MVLPKTSVKMKAMTWNKVSGRLHISRGFTRVDWDLSIYSACSGHDSNRVQTPAQKLPARLIKDSVWEGIGEDEELVRTMTDTDTFGRLEKLFGAADKPIAKKKEKEKKGPKIVTLLDAKRSSNISIMLAQFRISFVDIKVGGRLSTFYAGRFDWDLPIYCVFRS
jgi:hypothetical protein